MRAALCVLLFKVLNLFLNTLFNIIDLKRVNFFFKEVGQKCKDFMIKNTNILHASFKALNFAFCFNWANSKNIKDFMVNKWFLVMHLFLRACYDFDAFFCITNNHRILSTSPEYFASLEIILN